MFNDTRGASVVDKVETGVIVSNSNSGNNTELAKLVNMEVWYATTLWLTLISGWIDPTSGRRTKSNPLGGVMVKPVVPTGMLVPPSSGDGPVYYDPTRGSAVAPSWVDANNDVYIDPALFTGRRFWRSTPEQEGRPVRNIQPPFSPPSGYPMGPPEPPGLSPQMIGLGNNGQLPGPNAYTSPSALQQFGGDGKVPAIALFPATGPAAKLWKDVYANNGPMPQINVVVPPSGRGNTGGNAVLGSRVHQDVRSHLPTTGTASSPATENRIQPNVAQFTPGSNFMSGLPSLPFPSGVPGYSEYDYDDTINSWKSQMGRNGNLMGQQRIPNMFYPDSNRYDANNGQQMQLQNIMPGGFPSPYPPSSYSSSSEEVKGTDNLESKVDPAANPSNVWGPQNEGPIDKSTTVRSSSLESEAGVKSLTDTETNEGTKTDSVSNPNDPAARHTNSKKSRKSKSKKAPTESNGKLVQFGQTGTPEYDHPHAKHHSKRAKTPAAPIRSKADSLEEIDTSRKNRQQKVPRSPSPDNGMMRYQHPIDVASVMDEYMQNNY